jgi:hypothetical protein
MTDISEELAIRFSEYLDDEMTAEDRAAFEAELATDDALATALEKFTKTLDVLGGLTTPEVDLSAQVQTKIRRRSRGRYFGSHSLRRQRVQTEIFIAIALTLLAGIALIATPGGLRALLGTPEFELVEDPLDAVPDRPNEAVPDTPDGVAAEPEEEPPEALDASAGLPPAEPGRTTGAPVRPMIRSEFLYSVRSDLTLEALERRVRDQFGVEAVRVEDRAVIASLPRDQIAEVVPSLSSIGTVHRRREEIEGNPATLDIVFEARQ